jgi:competence protein ComEA
MRIKYLIAAALLVSIVSYAVVNHRNESPAETPQFVHNEHRMNVNSADMLALQQLKGIGRKRAKAIIDYREAHGHFQTLDDLAQVKGISRQTVRKLQDELMVG